MKSSQLIALIRSLAVITVGVWTGCVSFANGRKPTQILPEQRYHNSKIVQIAPKLVSKNNSNDSVASAFQLSAAETRQLQTANDQDIINVAVVMDTVNYEWVPLITEAVFSFINNHNDGFYDNIFVHDEDTLFRYELVHTACDENVARQGYWDVRNKLNGTLHGIVGCRCSGASVAVANVAGLEARPQISPVSSSAELSNDHVYPYFSRVAAPDNEQGQVGALIAMLEGYGWNDINIITTDTPFSKGMAEEFRTLWEQSPHRTVVYQTAPITVTSERVGTDAKSIDVNSACLALKGIPSRTAERNSRIILLFAHNEHAFETLELAHAGRFNTGTQNFTCDAPSVHSELIWITPEMRGQPKRDTSWMPDVPGFLSVVPYYEPTQNGNPVFTRFLNRLNEFRRSLPGSSEDWVELPDYAAYYMVDAIVLMVMTLASLRSDQRLDGQLVTSTLRTLTLDGVSGRVSLTPIGDRNNPEYTIYNCRKKIAAGCDWASVETIKINTASGTSESTFVSEPCFPNMRCGEIPEGSYDDDSDEISNAIIWSLIMVGIFFILFLLVSMKYWRSRKAKREFKQKVQSIDSKLEGINETMDQTRKRKADLIDQRARLQEIPSHWKNPEKLLEEITPQDDQYWAINDQLQETLPDAYISKVWRVQNISLWTYYSFHKNRLTMHGVKHHEREVWHGTSSLDPEIVYNDKQDGFMMQFASIGFWGRGIYFAEKSEYSDYYCHKPQMNPNDTSRSAAHGDEREMFLSKLLVGNAIHMDRHKSLDFETHCKSLTAPPVNPRTNLKYNTVTGHSSGSKVWVVYENGRAYPEYLIRYYRSPSGRDPKRTPYASKAEVSQYKSSGAHSQAAKHAVKHVSIDTVTVTTRAPSSSAAMSSHSGSSLGSASGQPISPRPVFKPTAKLNASFKAASDAAASMINTAAAAGSLPPDSSAGSLASSTSSTKPTAIISWEYKQDEYWFQYSTYHREVLENAYQLPTRPKKVILQTDQWRYEIDLKTMVQTNMLHPNRTQRKIRRAVIDLETWKEQQRMLQDGDSTDDELC